MLFQPPKPKGFMHTYIYADEFAALRSALTTEKGISGRQKSNNVKRKSFRGVERKTIFFRVGGRRDMWATLSLVLKLLILLFLIIILYCLIPEYIY